jgi:Phage tail tube protein
MSSDQRISGIAWIRAPRRSMIQMMGKFRISPSAVERVYGSGESHGFYELPRVPYIDIEDAVIYTKRWPDKITRIVAVLANGKTYVLQDAECTWAESSRFGVRMRFEGTTCEEINI